MKKIILSIFLMNLTILQLHAERISIAVFDFKPEGVSDTLARNTAELVRNELKKIDKYHVMGRALMVDIINEYGYTASWCYDEKCASGSGYYNLLVQKVVIGKLEKRDDNLYINLAVFNCYDSEWELRIEKKCKSEKEIPVTVKNMVKGISLYIKAIDYTKDTDYKIKYDPWYMGMQYQIGVADYDVNGTATFLIAFSLNNSYKSLYYYGARVGAMWLIRPNYSDDYDRNLYDYKKVYAGYTSGILTEYSAGINWRNNSGWFGITLYGGLGIYYGKAEFIKYKESNYILNGSYKYEETINHATPYLSFTLEVPMGRGRNFIGPMFQLLLLPTPSEVEQKVIPVFYFFSLKHVW